MWLLSMARTLVRVGLDCSVGGVVLSRSKRCFRRCTYIGFALALGTGSIASGMALSPPEPITTRQTIFSIPFLIDHAADPAREPIEVQLHVSIDRGITWRQYDRARPQQGHFLFRTPSDGEYWFTVRTLDRSNQLHPSTPPVAELCVIVDTSLPRLKLHAKRGPTGQIVANWSIDDAHPKPDSLQIQYRTSPEAPWQAVAIAPRQQGHPPSQEVAWYLQNSGSRVEIRAEVLDLAGNRAIAHAQVDLDQPAPATLPSAIGFMASSDGLPQGTSPAVAAQPSNSTMPVASTETEQAPNGFAPQVGQGLAGSNTGWQNSLPAGEDLPATASEMPSSSELVQTPPGANRSRYPDLVSNNMAVAPAGPTTVEPRPAIANRYTELPYTGPPSQANGPVPNISTQTNQVRWFRSQVFDIEYNDTQVAALPIHHVELWGTRDGGATWYSFGLDDDNRSPVRATVNTEGFYGFRVVLRNTAGQGDARPQNGDSPSTWVGVDLTPPVARIVFAGMTENAQENQCTIRWEANDAALIDRPISLYYRTRPEEAWIPIALQLPNTGMYLWPHGANMPNDIYLRLEVADAAKNVGSFETQSIVCLKRAKSSMTIRDSKSSLHSSQTLKNGTKRFFFK